MKRLAQHQALKPEPVPIAETKKLKQSQQQDIAMVHGQPQKKQLVLLQEQKQELVPNVVIRKHKLLPLQVINIQPL